MLHSEILPVCGTVVNFKIASVLYFCFARFFSYVSFTIVERPASNILYVLEPNYIDLTVGFNIKMAYLYYSITIYHDPPYSAAAHTMPTANTLIPRRLVYLGYYSVPASRSIH